MSQKRLVYSFVAKGSIILAKHPECLGNFSSIAIECLSNLRSSCSKHAYTCDGQTFNFLSDAAFVFLVVADESAGRSVPFVFLDRVKNAFKQLYGESIKDDTHLLAAAEDDLFEDKFSDPYGLDEEFGPRLKELMQYCEGELEKFNELSMSDVEEIMIDNDLVFGVANINLPSPDGSSDSGSAQKRPWRLMPELKRLERLGCGAIGRVYKSHNVIDKKDYAVKRIPYYMDDEEKVWREAYIFSLMDHEHILKYYMTWKENNPEKLSECSIYSSDSYLTEVYDSALYIIMEYCPRSLSQYLKDRQEVDETLSQKIFCQILSAVDYIHSRGIIHGDLHPGNILLDASGNVKIGDFDCAIFVSDGPVKKSKDLANLRHRCHDDLITVACDIFSLGVLLFDLLLKLNTESEIVDVFNQFKSGRVPPGWQYNLLITDLVAKMLSSKSSKRPTLPEVIAVFELDNILSVYEM